MTCGAYCLCGEDGYEIASLHAAVRSFLQGKLTKVGLRKEFDEVRAALPYLAAGDEYSKYLETTLRGKS